VPSFPFYILLVNISHTIFMDSGEEEEEPAANVTAPTSTSQTLVLSETRRLAEETSPPPQDLEMLTPAASPRAPSPKRARVELGEGQGLLAGSSTIPSLDDVSIFAAILFSVEFFSLDFPSDSLSASDEGVYSSRYSICWVS
jgi:hypothetical protein